MVRTLTPGSGAVISYPSDVNGRLYFFINDELHRPQLWTSDGTEAGTLPLRLYTGSGSGGADPYPVSSVGDTLFFVRHDRFHGRELWMSRGTIGTTVHIADFSGDHGDGVPGSVMAIGERLVVSAQNWDVGRELFTFGMPADPPQMFSPAGTVQHGLPTFEWDAVPGAVEYQLLIQDMTTVPKTVLDVIVNAASFVPAAGLSIGNYRTLVRARLADNQWTPWSVELDFRIVTRVEMVTPDETYPDGYPVFQWAEISGAAAYDIWINNLSSGETQVIRKQDIQGSSFVPESRLPLGRYHVWVRATDAAGVSSPWSVGVVTHVNTPPSMNGPDAITLLDRPQFTWTPVDGATRYELYVARISEHIAVMHETQINGLSFTPDTPLPFGTYQVWTRAFGPRSFLGSYSEPFLLQIGRAPVITGVAESHDQTWTVFWTSVGGAARYDIWVSAASSDGGPFTGIYFRDENVLTAAWQFSSWPSDDYRIWVRAITAAGLESPWSTSVLVSI